MNFMRVYLSIPKPEGGLELRTLTVPQNAPVSAALSCAGLSEDTACGVFCEKVSSDYILSPEDRIDVAVPLALSPMQVRRLRAENKTKTAVPRPRHGGVHQLIKPLDENL